MGREQIFGGIAIVAIAIVVALNVNMVNKKSDNASALALANIEALTQGETGGSSWDCSTYTSKVEDEYTEDCYDANGQRVRKIAQRYATRVCNSGWFSYCYPGEIFTSFDCEGNSRVYDNTQRSTCF